MVTRCVVELPAGQVPAFNESETPCISKTSDTILKEIVHIHKQYSDEVWKSENLADYSKALYIDMANNFVRWIQGGFTPGAAGLKPRRRTRQAPLT